MIISPLDCRGLACPEPVVRCRNYLQEHPEDILKVLVDNRAAMENVSAFLTRSGYTVDTHEVKENPPYWVLIGAVNAGVFNAGALDAGAPAPRAATNQGQAFSVPKPLAPALSSSLTCGPRKTVVFLSTETLGRGDDSLGQKLMLNFLGTLPELGDELWRLILVNGAVKLATNQVEGALAKLQALEQTGVNIMVCGTCLEHFQLLGQRSVGETTNMLDIITCMQLADKVIRP